MGRKSVRKSVQKSLIAGMSAAVALALLVVSGATACAQQTYARPYDGIQAGIDSYRLGEEQRRAKLGAQLYLNDAFGYRSFAPGGLGYTDYYRVPVGGVMYDSLAPAGVTYSSQTYSSGIGLGYGYQSSYSSFYAPGGYYGGGGFYGATVGPAYAYPASPSVYSTYVYPTAPLVRQPIGQRQVQTGPNRWESHPVYETPISNYPVPYAPESADAKPDPVLLAPPPPAPEPVEGAATTPIAPKPVGAKPIASKPAVKSVKKPESPVRPAAKPVTRREF
jgi:hypothetical protein